MFSGNIYCVWYVPCPPGGFFLHWLCWRCLSKGSNTFFSTQHPDMSTINSYSQQLYHLVGSRTNVDTLPMNYPIDYWVWTTGQNLQGALWKYPSVPGNSWLADICENEPVLNQQKLPSPGYRCCYIFEDSATKCIFCTTQASHFSAAGLKKIPPPSIIVISDPYEHIQPPLTPSNTAGMVLLTSSHHY